MRLIYTDECIQNDILRSYKGTQKGVFCFMNLVSKVCDILSLTQSIMPFKMNGKKRSCVEN